jgi:hypothetical protein
MLIEPVMVFAIVIADEYLSFIDVLCAVGLKRSLNSAETLVVAGMDALDRLPLPWRMRDELGLNRAGVISGYIGSPPRDDEREFAKAANWSRRNRVIFRPHPAKASAMSKLRATDRNRSRRWLRGLSLAVAGILGQSAFAVAVQGSLRKLGSFGTSGRLTPTNNKSRYACNKSLITHAMMRIAPEARPLPDCWSGKPTWRALDSRSRRDSC